jgi:hypothetical protein
MVLYLILPAAAVSEGIEKPEQHANGNERDNQ